MKRKLFPAIIFIFAACQPSEDLSAPSATHQRSSFSNIILISIDTLRPDRLGAYGYPLPTSPFLDRIIAKSSQFADVLAQVPSTIGSHRSILTSKYLFEQKNKSPDPAETLAGLLASNGWATAAFVDGGLMNRQYGHAAGFELYDDDGGGLAAIRQKALSWIHSRHNSNSFLFIHAYDVHCPYQPPEELNTLFKDRGETWFETNGKCGGTYFNKLNLAKSDFDYISALYDSEVRACDREISLLFQDLARLGILDRSLVFFFSDHGESIGERNYIGHNELYDVQLRILTAFLASDHKPFLDATPCESIDIAPTILNLAGYASPSFFKGKSIAFPDRGKRCDRTRISETHHKAVRTDDDWVLIIRDNPGADELYRLSDDPEQLVNRALEQPEIVSGLVECYLRKTNFNKTDLRKRSPYGMLKIIKSLRRADADSTPEDQPENQDAKLQEQLKKLGYIE